MGHHYDQGFVALVQPGTLSLGVSEVLKKMGYENHDCYNTVVTQNAFV